MKRANFGIALLATAAVAANVSEMRTHYLITDTNRTPLYEATVITTSGQERSTETYLLRNTAGQKVRIDVDRQWASGKVTSEYSVNGGKAVKVTLQMPGSARTRDEWRQEMKAHPELQTADIPVTIEGRGKVVKTAESEWKSGRASVRSEAKAATGAEFIAAISPIRTLLGFPQFGGACSTYEFVSDGQRCAGSTQLRIGATRPDCDFDAAFGAPCSLDQKLHAKAQPVNGKVGAY